MADKKASVKRLLLLTQPRTASHLLERMLSKQPGLVPVPHPFLQARSLGGNDGGEKLVNDLASGAVTKEQSEALKNKFDNSFDAVLKKMESIEAEGNISFFHEHPFFLLDPALANEFYRLNSGQHTADFDPPGSPNWTLRYPGETAPRARTNPTMCPDDFLIDPSVRIIMPIRHPALVFPSSYRALIGVTWFRHGDPQMPLYQSYRWHRQLYEWLASNAPPESKPILIDADDVMDEHGPVMRRLCEEVGIDPDAVLYEWEALTDEQRANMSKRTTTIMDTLLSSSRLRSDKTSKNLVLEEQVKKWKEEFGEATGGWLEEVVKEEMENYNYLRERRLRA